MQIWTNFFVFLFWCLINMSTAWAYFVRSSWRRSWPRRAAMPAGVWPSLFAKRRASLAPDCCSRKCMTRRRPRRAAKCSKVSCGLTSRGEAGGKRWVNSWPSEDPTKFHFLTQRDRPRLRNGIQQNSGKKTAHLQTGATLTRCNEAGCFFSFWKCRTFQNRGLRRLTCMCM